MEHASQVIEDEIFDDGARRARTAVQYDDGLSEDQWLLVNHTQASLPLTLAKFGVAGSRGGG